MDIYEACRLCNTSLKKTQLKGKFLWQSLYRILTKPYGSKYLLPNCGKEYKPSGMTNFAAWEGGWDTGEIAYLADIQHPFEYKSEAQVNKTETENLFYNFLSSYRDSDDTFYYRDLLRRQYNSGNYFVTVNLEHLSKVNEILANNIIENPTEYLPLFENAINRAVDEMTRPRPPTAPFKPLQLTISSDQNPIPIRELDAQHISKLVKVPGIVINVSSVKAKATIIFLACKNCGNTKRISLKSGFSGINFPRRCDREPIGGEEDRCPLDPYEIVGDKCTLVDQQVLKLQESPEMVPTGELPRHVLLSVDRFLTNTVMAGSRVTTVGIFDIYQNSTFKSKSDLTTRTPYIRVVGFMHDKEEDGRGHLNYSSEDETLFIALSKLPDIYERIARSISPTILGSVDIKKALACLLFGGSRKRLPDGLKLRGDINVLLLGDPGTAKSQLLKYVEKMAPVAVYTSGKGSSAAGLTASVIRDPASRDFHLEAGAMVLADGGVACIDEFDKMRESDRVAIHEAMEQQTISIAKAGITTILNSRTSVLAAANSTFGRWDDSPGPEQNIDFQATILSRFDCIFIVKDTYDEHSDSSIAMHVIRFHQKSTEVGSETSQTILDPELLKKYINYAKRTCGPRLSEEAKERLISEFVSFRQSTRNSRSAITVTVRQLEALVRISEAIAKMRLAKFASLGDVEEALRLFRVSTLDAAKNGDVTILEGMQGSGDKSLSREIEKRIQRRFFIGANVSERVIIEDFLQQGYPEAEIRKALWIMVKRGDLEYRYQRKVLHRFR